MRVSGGGTRRLRCAVATAVLAALLTGCDGAGQREADGERAGGAASAARTDDDDDAGAETGAKEPGPSRRSEDRARGAAPGGAQQRPARGRVDVRFPRAVRMLRQAPERSGGYDRDLFVHWTDSDGDGCDTRDEVLLAEAVRRPRVVGDCDLLDGRWRSAYDGVTTRDPSTFDVDHVVPLAEAWASGARRWRDGRRESFANDQGDRRSLAAVSASSNRSKSDGDPADWQPDLARCRYLRDWTAVKLRWDLAVDPRERRVLTRGARRCEGRVAVRLVATGANARTDDGVGTRSRPAPRPAPAPGPAPDGSSGGATDPRFDTCGDANDAGYGDYVRGVDPEYAWYDDRDGDGTVCEG